MKDELTGRGALCLFRLLFPRSSSFRKNVFSATVVFRRTNRRKSGVDKHL